MSKLRERINADYLSAFKARETLKKNLLGLVKSTIDNEEKNGKANIEDADVEKILSKFEKNLDEVVSKSPSDESKQELEIIKSYLPKKISESEIEDIISDLISKGASNIGAIMAGFKDKPVDKKLVSTLAQKHLVK